MSRTSLKLATAAVVVVGIVAFLAAMLRPGSLNKTDDATDTHESSGTTRRLVIAPNAQSSWRKHHSGMCSALPRREGGYRVWLTGREQPDGPFVIGWVDLDDRFRVVDESTEPCLRPESKDAKGVLMPCVVESSDQLRMYFTGHLPGVAFSRDAGKTWTIQPERILKQDSVDPVSLGTNCVVKDGDTWRTFYTSVQPKGPGKGFRDDRFLIRYAESADGLSWTKPANNLSLDADPEGTSARPNVWQDGARWLMLYSRAPKMTRDNPGRQYRIHIAESSDGKTFHDLGEVLGPSSRKGDFDDERVAYAWSLPDDRSLFLYSGNDFGRTGIGLAKLHVPRSSINRSSR
jgi:hypothetical protein